MGKGNKQKRKDQHKGGNTTKGKGKARGSVGSSSGNAESGMKEKQKRKGKGRQKKGGKGGLYLDTSDDDYKAFVAQVRSTPRAPSHAIHLTAHSV